MTEIQKNQISAKLADYVARFDSQKSASDSLLNVSDSTVSQILNGKTELVSDRMWRNIGTQVGWNQAGKEWNLVETSAYVKLRGLFDDAQAYSNVFALCGDSGCGKSATIKSYRDNNRNVYALMCSEFWNRNLFMHELLTQMGVDASGFNMGELMAETIRQLKTKESPLIIFDEADKLSDKVLYFFITLYNQLEDHCGIVLCATDYLEKRIRRGLRLNKKGYKEIFSRIGRKFITIAPANSADVAAVCMANGVTDRAQINEVMKDVEAFDNDLRRVARKVHAIKQSRNG